MPTIRLIRELERLKEIRGLPDMVRTDYGPEFISSELDIYGSIRREFLNANIFTSLREVRDIAEEWMMDYNQNRLHQALGYKTPLEYDLRKGKKMYFLARKTEGAYTIRIYIMHIFCSFDFNLG